MRGFVLHPHFGFLRDLWSSLGYKLLWSDTVDLGDVAPSTRPRYLAVFARADVAPPAGLPRFPMVLPKRPTLRSFKCILRLPDALREPCQLSPEVLDIYMDPQYMPRSGRGHKPQTPSAFRLRSLDDRAGCMMACYHFQHQLPESCLDRSGILATLLQEDSGPRFFAGAEIAMMHAAVKPVLLPSQDRIQMRGLGNSLAVPQALMCLLRAVAVACPVLADTALTDMLELCMSSRIHNENFIIYPCDLGWCLCKLEQSGEVLSLLSCSAPWGQLCPRQALRFHQWLCYDEFQRICLVLPEGVPLVQALRLWNRDLSESDALVMDLSPPVLFEGPLPSTCTSVVELPELPSLRLEDMPCAGPDAHQAGLIMIIGRDRYYFVVNSGPTLVAHLNAVVQLEAGEHGDPQAIVHWESASGVPIRSWRELSGVVVLHHMPPLDFHTGPRFPVEAIQCVSVLSHACPIRVHFAEPWDAQLAHTMPVARLNALGWKFTLLPATQPSPGYVGLFLPQVHRLAIAEEAVLPCLAEVLLQGCLAYHSALEHPVADQHTVQVQIRGRNLWLGNLPGSFTFGQVLQLWQRARLCLGLTSAARIYSGPRPVSEDLSLAEARVGASCAWLNRKGRLLLTVQPRCSGGGAKDAKYIAAQTALAQTMLDRGMSLADASATVDKLLPKAGLSRVQRLVGIVQADNRWESLLQLANQFDVALPPTTSRVEKAAIKVQAAFRKRQQAKVSAKDFQLQPHCFYNEDGTEATILTQLYPGCSGILLSDASEALQHIQAFQSHTLDELGIAVVGHCCPHADSCCGRQTLPALNSGGEPVLISVCLHQLGQKKLEFRCKHAATISVASATCVAFTVFGDEWDEHAWSLIRANPVRQVVKVLQASGLSQPLRAPWGRSFRLGQQPSTAAEADSVQFHAQVATADLPLLLRRSGYNRVYLTPKTWEHALHPNWSIVWLPGDKDQVSQQAATFQSQFGLARLRKRYGLRVETSAFPAAHRSLKPAHPLPIAVEVKQVYRISNTPPGLLAADVVAWGTAVSWLLKPLRSQGPRQWLVGAASPPPQGTLSMNGHPILIQPQLRNMNEKVVSAGRARLSGIARQRPLILGQTVIPGASI